MNAPPSVIAVIPARYASTRLPGKPLVDLCGKPMILHVMERARLAARVGRVLVATDDERIASVVRAGGGEAVLTPPACRTGSDRVAHVARNLPGAEIIVNVQGDEPLLAPEMIDEAVRPLAEDPGVVVATLAKRITDGRDVTNPAVVKVTIDSRGYALYFSRSPIPHVRGDGDPGMWHARAAYYKHIGLYVYRREALLAFSTLPESPLERAEQLEQLRLLEHGYRIKVAETAHDSTPVDTPDDVGKVRGMMKDLTPVQAG
jgi:3-deoxy-manno-octulosonate cytidylyltransferase (CMP-KDO synthetase)